MVKQKVKKLIFLPGFKSSRIEVMKMLQSGYHIIINVATALCGKVTHYYIKAVNLLAAMFSLASAFLGFFGAL